jgi:ankyrin repeat protein
MRLFPFVRRLVIARFVLLAATFFAQEYAPKFPPFTSDRPDLVLPHPALVAARYGKADEVRKFLDAGVSVNACDSSGQTLIRAALERDHVELARELMQRGFNPNLVYRVFDQRELVEIGSGVLPFAAKVGAEDIVDALLAKGISPWPTVYAPDPLAGSAVVNAIESDRPAILRKLLASVGAERRAKMLHGAGSYAFLAACQRTAAIDVLLAAGATIDATSANGPFPSVLHTYAQRGWAEGVAKLLALGADATVKDRRGKLPEDVATTPEIARQLHAAAVGQHLIATAPASVATTEKVPTFPTELLTAMLDGHDAQAIARVKDVAVADLNATDDRGWTILTYALKEKKTAFANTLLEAGANAAHITAKGSSMVAFAATTGDTALVKNVVAKGGKVDASRFGSATALIMAVQASDRPMVETLLALGAKADPPRPRNDTDFWWSALMAAAKIGDVALMQRMLEAGADLNAVDSNGEGALFWAVRSGHVEALTFCVKRGLSPAQKTPRGTNPLTLAASLGATDMVKALLALGVTHPDALDYAESGAHNETAAVLREWKQRTNPNDPLDLWRTGRTTTMAEVRAWLAQGGDKNFNESEQTPLQHMAWLGNVEAVRLLLEKGADPRLTGSDPCVAVFYALNNMHNRDDNQALAMLRVFIEHGVSPDAQTYVSEMDRDAPPSGDTLVTRAVQACDWKCVRYLLEKGANPSRRGGFSDRNAFDALSQCQSLDANERGEIRGLLNEHARPEPRDVPPPVARPRTKSAAL